MNYKLLWQVDRGIPLLVSVYKCNDWRPGFPTAGQGAADSVFSAQGTLSSMLLILGGNSEHIPHAWRKMGFMKKTKANCPYERSIWQIGKEIDKMDK